jgi:hypothetical protein
MENWISWIPGLMLGVALSAGSGFRIFIPLLTSNLAARFGWVDLSENFAWMASDTATVVLLVATLAEIAAYYIPFIDNLLDTIAMPSSVAAGTILTSQFLEINDPAIQWGLGLLAGGGVAGTVQTGTSLLRLGSTKFTAGLGNGVVSTIENIISTVVSLVAVWLPIFMGILTLLFLIWLFKKISKIKITRNKITST